MVPFAQKRRIGTRGSNKTTVTGMKMLELGLSNPDAYR